MLRRTIPLPVKLIIVESPNKVAKIGSFLSSVEDWSFGQQHLKPLAKDSKERAAVIPTVGHFLELSNIVMTPKPLLPQSSKSSNATPAASPSPPPQSAEAPAAKKKSGGKKKKTETTAVAISRDDPIVDLSVFGDAIGRPLRHLELKWVPQSGKTTAETIVNTVQQYGKDLTEIILASDPDREGELIAYHARNVIQNRLPNLKAKFSRAYIHSITEAGVIKAMTERRPQFIDEGLAVAAETRHAMDRMFGYLGSSMLRHMNPQFRSVGRVQTPALISIAERENRIERYMKEHSASFSIQAKCLVIDEKGNSFVKTITLTEITPGKEAAEVAKIPKLSTEDTANPKVLEAHSQQVTEAYFKALKMHEVSKITMSPDQKQNPTISTSTSQPPLPFTMATLISRANRLYRMSSEEVAKSLQELFQSGLITYPRTDSHRIDPTIIPSIQSAIEKQFGKAFVRNLEDNGDSGAKPSKPKKDGSKKKGAAAAADGNAEDAHEAIRPTYVEKTDAEVRTMYGKSMDSKSLQLYDLIRNTTLAAFMTPMTQERVSTFMQCTTGSGAVLGFRLESKKTTHAGFQAALRGGGNAAAANNADDENPEEGNNGGEALSEYDVIQKLPKRLKEYQVRIEEPTVLKSKPSPPPQLTEGTLIELLKEKGVGRPSTYPSIINTLLTRGYVSVNANARLETTLVGRNLVTATQKACPSLVSMGFTAEFEEKLDRIARAGSAGASDSDLVLSAFLLQLFHVAMDATTAHRRELLKRSVESRTLHQNPNATEEQVTREVEAAVSRGINMSDLFRQMSDAKDFNEVQRRLDSFLRREYPR